MGGRKIGRSHSPRNRHKASLSRHDYSHQITKIKQVENTLRNMLKKSNPELDLQIPTQGGIDNRIDNITRLTEKLSNTMKANARDNAEITNKETSIQTTTSASKENEVMQDDNGKMKKRNKKSYTPLDLTIPST